MSPILPPLFIDTPPTKTTYYYGELFDPTGMVVKARKKDDTIITITNYRWSPTLPLTHNDTTITISANGYSSATQAITVLPILVSISIDTPPTKTTYTEGEYFDTTGMVVKANYSDGTSETITGYTISNTGPLSVIDTTIVISYQGKTANQAITVLFVLLFISIQIPPTKTTYLDGEYFDPTGMVVQAYYLNHGAAIITNYSILNPGPLGLNDSYVTISFRNATALQTITVLPVLTSISIDTAPYKTVYRYDDYFEPYGMVVKAHYSDGSSETITDYTFSPTSPLEALDTQITIYYQGKTATQIITTTSSPPLGRFPLQNISGAETRNNPLFNVFELSTRFITKKISVGRDSYTLSLYFVYHSRMIDPLSDLCKGLPKRFKTNYHQFLIQDGSDSNNNPLYKFIDGEGYIHTFFKLNSDLYYCSNDNLYLQLNDENHNFYSRIVDCENNQLYFSSNNHLVMIISGKDENNIKRVTYNGDYLSRVYDERDVDTYLNFVYNNIDSTLIRVDYVYRNIVIKSLSIIQSNGFINEMYEEITNEPGVTKQLYKFSYNVASTANHSSYDRLELIEDCCNNDAFKIHYSFVTSLNDYIVDYLEKGIIDENVFLTKELCNIVSYSFRSDDNQTINETTITHLGIAYSYSLNKKAQITAVLEKETNSCNFRTLYKNSGVKLGINGQESTYINGSMLLNVPYQKNVSLDADALALLNCYRHFVLRMHIRVKSNSFNRIRAVIVAPNITAEIMNIDKTQYEQFQLIEIPFSKTTNSSISSLTITIWLVNENSNSVNVDIGDVYIDKKARTKLMFSGGTYSFSDITSIGIYNQYFENEPERTILLSGQHVFSAEDFLRSFVADNNYVAILYNQTFGDGSRPLYFDNGDYLDFYRFRFCLLVNNIVVFNSFSPGNSNLDSSNTWYFETISPDERVVTKTFYRYIGSDLEIITRTINNNEILSFKEEIRRYDGFNGVLLKISKSHYERDNNNNNVLVSSEIAYSYFTNGELQSIVQSSGEQTIVLYQAYQNSDYYTYRMVSGLQSVDIIYDKYLESESIRNEVNATTGLISNSSYKKVFQYDDFFEDILSVSFCHNDINQIVNGINIDYENHETTISINNIDAYKLCSDSINDMILLKRFNGLTFDNVLSTKQTALLEQRTYFYSPNNIIVTNVINQYGKAIQQKLNNDIKTTFNYETIDESVLAEKVSIVVDGYLGVNPIITAYDYNEIDNSLSSIQFGNDFGVEINNEENETVYSFNEPLYTDEIKIKGSKLALSYSLNGSNTTNFVLAVKTDNFERIKSIVKAGYDCSQYICDYHRPQHLNNIYIFDFISVGINIQTIIFREIYSYDSYGNINEIFRMNTGLPFDEQHPSYSYDGFGRIVSESNPLIDVSRTYSYDSNGRMCQVNNEIISYNSKGQLSSFGGVLLSYDNYGNRTSKGNIAYEWERGKLLKRVTIGNQIIDFKYDYLGRRYQKICDNVTTTYFYHENKIIGENRSDGTKLRYFYDGVGIAGFRYYHDNTYEDYDYVRNPLGMIIGIFNGSRIIIRYEYDAWGNHDVLELAETDIGDINPIRFKGYYYDQETNLYYLISRYYDPLTYSFISLDDFDYLNLNKVSGHNLYIYCYNNPVMYTDGDGHLAIWLSVLIFAGIGFATTFIKDWIDDGVPFNGTVSWREYIGSVVGGAISGLGIGTNFLSTIISSGVGEIIEDLIGGNVNGFIDLLKSFGTGMTLGAISYAIGAGVNRIASAKINGILGESMDNIKINKRLAAAGFKYLKIGKLGYDGVYKVLYKQFGFQSIDDLLQIVYEAGTGFLDW